MVEIATDTPQEIGLYRGDGPERIRALVGRLLHAQAELDGVLQPDIPDAAGKPIQRGNKTDPAQDIYYLA